SIWILASAAGLTTMSEARRLLARSGSFFLRYAGEYAQNFVFLHDEEIFAVNLDFSAGVLAEQNAVAFFHCEREYLAFFVAAPLAGGDDFAFLRLVLGRVGDNDTAPGSGGFFNAPNQDAVVQRGELGSHDSYRLLSAWYLSLGLMTGPDLRC